MEPRGSRAAEVWPVAALVAAAAPLILFGLGSYSVVNGDEAIYHAIAAGMVESGDWIQLQFKGSPRDYDTFMNAPVQYWARALLITAFGDNAWTMRILSALLGVAVVVATYALARCVAGRGAATVAGLVQLTTLQFVYLHSARTGELDTGVALLVVLAALFFVRAIERGSGFALHHLCLVALMNLKLPVSLIPAAAALACFALVPRARARLPGWLVTGAVLLPLGLAWHVWRAVEMFPELQTVVAAMTGQASGRIAQAGDAGPLSNAAFYARTVLFGAFPYAFVYPLALWGALRCARDGEGGEGWRWRVLLLYTVAVFGFYLLVAKRYPWYILPAYPFLSVFVGAWLARLDTGRVPLALLAVALALVGWVSADATGFHPFALRAAEIPMELSLRRLPGVPAWLGPGVSAALLAGAAWLAAARSGPRFARGLAVAVGAVLLVVGAVRTALPLAHLGYQSEMARVHHALADAAAAGRSPDLPLVMRESSLWIARYYFADDYEIVPLRRGPEMAVALYPLGDPRAEGRSVRRGVPELARQRRRRDAAQSSR